MLLQWSVSLTCGILLISPLFIFKKAGYVCPSFINLGMCAMFIWKYLYPTPIAVFLSDLLHDTVNFIWVKHNYIYEPSFTVKNFFRKFSLNIGPLNLCHTWLVPSHILLIEYVDLIHNQGSNLFRYYHLYLQYLAPRILEYWHLLKTGSLDNAIQGSTIMVYEPLYHALQKWRAYVWFFGPFYFYWSLVFYILGAFLIKQLFPSLLLEMTWL